jgi:aerobic C4-dicarboxylate transport protein
MTEPYRPAPPLDPSPKPFYKSLYFQVLSAIVLGAVLGVFFPDFSQKLKPLGDGFIKLIKMLIAPIVFTTIVVGIASMEDMKKVGRVGAKALIYFEVVTTVALGLGLLVVNVLRPGVGVNATLSATDAQAVESYSSGAHHLSTVDFILNAIPANAVEAFAKGEILQVLVFSVLFGLAVSKMGSTARPLVELLDRFSHALFGVVGMVMKLAERSAPWPTPWASSESEPWPIWAN